MPTYYPEMYSSDKKETENQKLFIICENSSNDPHPHCPHGPTLLFYHATSTNQHCQSTKRLGYFGCSAHRDKKSCSFHLPACDLTKSALEKRYPIQAKEFRKVHQALVHCASKDRRFCQQCQVAFIGTENSSHQGHEVLKEISEDLMKDPTQFMKPLENDKIEAQYFFDSKTLEFFGDCFKQLDIKKVICIGAPRLHAHIMSGKSKTKTKSFLLDYDHRFLYFYDSSQFAWYNMCNNYFFEDNSSFEKFLKTEKNENILILMDPPFGCRTEPITNTIKQITQLYSRLNTFEYRPLPVFWIFPYFSENYIREVMPEMDMHDFKVNYSNHETYHSEKNGRKLGSPVRLFTNIPLELINLSSNKEYKLCTFCNKWTALENLHCNKCGLCPSKNGSTYRHCDYCALCVKPNYVHCENCRRCTQKQNHNCLDYQTKIRCWICKQVGHTETSCTLLPSFMQKKRNKSVKGCLICSCSNHNERFCPKKRNIIRKYPNKHNKNF